MENAETTKSNDGPELKEAKSEDWVKFKVDELKIRIGTYRFYLNLALQINGFFYLTTGAVLGFYLKEPNEHQANSHLVYFLWLPILIGAVLGGIFLYGAKLGETGSRAIEAIRRDLNAIANLDIQQIPDINEKSSTTTARFRMYNYHDANRTEQIVAGEPRLRVLHQLFILSGCRDSRGHLNSDVGWTRDSWRKPVCNVSSIPVVSSPFAT